MIELITAKAVLYGSWQLASAGRWTRRLSGWLVMISCLGLLGPSTAQAHPLDEFYQVTFITVTPERIELKVELYTGILIAPQILSLIDSNQDDQISETEARSYTARFLDDVTFELDHKGVPLGVTSLDFPNTVDLQAGVGIIRFSLSAETPGDQSGPHHFYYHNHHLPDIANYLVNVLSGDPARIQLGRQERDVFQASLRLDYTVLPGGSGPVEPAPTPIPAAPVPVSAGQERLNRYLYDPNLSPGWMIVVVGLATLLGGLHALTPGHGKSLVAAYLVGSRGTVKHAVALGGIVTFTHTASVIIIGLLALLASQFIVPRVLVPVLEILSGLLVIYIGGQLIWVRWRDYRAENAHHPQVSDHGHDHSHDHHSHHPHPHDHHHLPEQIKMRDLLALGISGGLIPCPEALGIMLIAIGINRTLFGLGLVIAFSLGLALVLVLIGILLVRVKSLLDRFGSGQGAWQTLLPLISALIVTLLGVGIMVKGLLPFLSG